MVGIPIGLAAAGDVFQLLKQWDEKRRFRKIVLRELEEVTPYPSEPMTNGQWNQLQQKRFLHQKVFDAPSENKALLLRLPQDLVYFVNQLWAAQDSGNSGQWLHFLGKLSQPTYDPNGKIRKARVQWEALIKKYEELDNQSGSP